MNENRKIFEYSLPEKRESLGELMDNFPIRDEKKVADFIRNLNAERAEEKKQNYSRKKMSCISAWFIQCRWICAAWVRN